MSTPLPTPTDYALRDAMRALILAADPTAIIPEAWLVEVVAGQSLNALRREDGRVRGVMLSLKDEKRTRVGDVPYEAEKALATKYALKIERTYRLFIVDYFDDIALVVSEDPPVIKFTEQLFNEWLDAIVNNFSRAPKLGANARVESHDELYVFDRRILPFGGERAHAANGLLTVRLHQTITPT